MKDHAWGNVPVVREPTGFVCRFPFGVDVAPMPSNVRGKSDRGSLSAQAVEAMVFGSSFLASKYVRHVVPNAEEGEPVIFG